MAIRIPYDSLTLRAVVGEMQSLVGGQIQHVAQPLATDIVLTLRGKGANHHLLLSCDANWARAHLTQTKRPNPPSPPPFCMLCRKYIEGGRIAAIRQRGLDRILDLEIHVGDGQVYFLMAELMGKHSNIILTNDEGTILDAAKRITHKISRTREILPGKAYVRPPAQADRLNPFEVSRDEVVRFADSMPADTEAQAARWMSRFDCMSPFLAEEVTMRGRQSNPIQAWQDIFGAAAAGQWEPVILRNERSETIGAYPFPTVQADRDVQFARDTINTALDHYYGAALPRAVLDSARHELETALNRAIKAREKQLESLHRSVEESSRAESYREAGELLLANLHRIDAEADTVGLDDYYNSEGGVRRIVLDPSKSARANAESYFRRYRKAKDGREIQAERLARTVGGIQVMRDALTALSGLADIQDVKRLRADLLGQGLLRREAEPEGPGHSRPRTPDFGGKKIRVYHAPEGWDIYLGENSEANDYLTSKVASPNDWWLHVRSNASAHVVIRTRNSPMTVPQSVIHRAAVLAAQHSASKHSEMVPVDYTLKKFVRRPKGSASGAALYQNEKTIHVIPKDSNPS